MKILSFAEIWKTVRGSLESLILKQIHLDRDLPIQLDITNLCNLRCQHCYHPHHKNEGALSLLEWFEILSQYETLRNKMGYRPSLILCGGEPLLSPMLFPILDRAFAINPDFKVTILSNGTLISAGILEKLKRYPRIAFQISLDGPTSASHEQTRGKGSFEKTQSGVSALVNAGYRVQLLAVLSRRNAELISDFFDLAKLWRVNLMNFTRLIVNGQAEILVREGRDHPLTALELRDAYQSILTHSARTGVRTSTSTPLMHLLHPALGRNGRFWESIIIDYQGKMLASSRSRLVLGHALKDGLEKIFLEHPILNSLRQGEVEDCGRCPHFKRCGGDRNAAFASTGNFLAADPGCWIGNKVPALQGVSV